MIISKEKAKRFTKNPIRYKLEETVIERDMMYKYLGVEISSDINKEVQQQAHKATSISGYFRDIWLQFLAASEI